MPVRRLPVRPDQQQLHRQAKELLRAVHAGDANAIAELREHHPEPIDPSGAKLADAQLVLARTYGASSWTRLVHAVQLSDAIWRDDAECVRALIVRNRTLLHEHVLIRTDSGWGPPMMYAASLGRDGIVRFLHGHGARDLEPAAGRAALHIAAYFDELEIAEWLLDREMDPDVGKGQPDEARFNAPPA